MTPLSNTTRAVTMVASRLARRILPPTLASCSRSLSVGTTPGGSHGVDQALQTAHVKAAFRSMAMQDDDVFNDLAYSLSFADNSHEEAAAAGAWQFSVLSDPRMLRQLEKSRNQCIMKQPQASSGDEAVDTQALPRTLTDALRPSRRAIVITESAAPFRIWNVNPAWEQLCGYSFLESRGKTLGSLLKGKETDTVASTALITKLLQGEEEAGTTLINYHKDGHSFTNRVRVGPIYDENHKVTHFVGVLQQVSA